MKKLLLVLTLACITTLTFSQACVIIKNFQVKNVTGTNYYFEFDHLNPSSGNKMLNIAATINGVAISGFPICLDSRNDAHYTSPTFSVTNLSNLTITLTPMTGNDCNGTSCSAAVISIGGGVLPLSLVSFTAENKDGAALLKWATASEVNTDLFAVERSIDGISFHEIGKVTAKGSGNSAYQFSDIAKVSASKIFYRLKMMDKNGSFTYSNIIWLSNSETDAFILYPNPVHDVLSIFNKSRELLNSTACISDLQGRIIKRINIASTQQLVNISSLPAGSYLVRFANGKSQPIVKL